MCAGLDFDGYFATAPLCISLGEKCLNAFEVPKHHPSSWDTGLTVSRPLLKDRHKTCEDFRHLVPTEAGSRASLPHLGEQKTSEPFFRKARGKLGQGQALKATVLPHRSMLSPVQGRS